MAVIKLAFTPQLYTNPFTKEIDLIYVPKVTIFIKVNSILYPFKIDAHVDSGATRNLFPADPLKSLGIKLENKRKRTHYGIGGKEVISYTHDVEVLIDRYKFITEIDFSAEHRPPLLGVEGFFAFFDSVHFNMFDKELELKYPLRN